MCFVSLREQPRRASRSGKRSSSPTARRYWRTAITDRSRSSGPDGRSATDLTRPRPPVDASQPSPNCTASSSRDASCRAFSSSHPPSRRRSRTRPRSRTFALSARRLPTRARLPSRSELDREVRAGGSALGRDDGDRSRFGELRHHDVQLGVGTNIRRSGKSAEPGGDQSGALGEPDILNLTALPSVMPR
jgi:hypothetical protein